MLTGFDGVDKGQSLEIKVKLFAPPESILKVNGVIAKVTAKEPKVTYEATVNLDGYRNVIEVLKKSLVARKIL